MTKISIEDLPIEGKRVLMRVDFNVPLDGEGRVTDATRIIAALPSIEYVLAQGGALILMTHLGRPLGAPNPELSLVPLVPVLETLLKRPVTLAPDCVGERVGKLAAAMQPGDVLLLENLRFHRAEMHPEEDPSFAQKLASLADFYVNDAFGTAHRQHSSTYTIAQHFPGKAAAGFLLNKEIHFLGDMLASPKRPFYAILGGAKVSTKLGVVKALLEKVDRLLIGGGMSYTFLKALGVEVGDSLVEEELIPEAEELCKTYGEKLVLPLDVLAAKACSEKAEAQLIVYEKGGIPARYQGLDIGPKTVEYYCTLLKQAEMILWNGPVGVYEFDRFAVGTQALAKYIGELPALSLIGGGDLIAAVNQAEVSENITHISTGGGATLEYLEYGTLPGIEALSTAVRGTTT